MSQFLARLSTTAAEIGEFTAGVLEQRPTQLSFQVDSITASSVREDSQETPATWATPEDLTALLWVDADLNNVRHPFSFEAHETKIFVIAKNLGLLSIKGNPGTRSRRFNQRLSTGVVLPNSIIQLKMNDAEIDGSVVYRSYNYPIPRNPNLWNKKRTT